MRISTCQQLEDSPKLCFLLIAGEEKIDSNRKSQQIQYYIMNMSYQRLLSVLYFSPLCQCLSLESLLICAEQEFVYSSGFEKQLAYWWD